MHAQAESEKNQRSGIWRPIILIGAVLLVLVVSQVFDLGQYLQSLRSWIDELGPLGPLVFIVLYSGAVVAALPGSALTVIAGAIFGSVIGVIVVSIAATLGASLSFLVSRYFAREATAQWLSKSDKFRRLDEMTEERGAIIVALTRLVPLFPFNLLNYGFGLTRVPFWTYVFWSWLCMLPGTVLYVVGADAFSRGLAEGEVPWNLIVGVVVAAAVLAALVRYAKTKLEGNTKEA